MYFKKVLAKFDKVPSSSRPGDAAFKSQLELVDSKLPEQLIPRNVSNTNLGNLKML